MYSWPPQITFGLHLQRLDGDGKVVTGWPEGGLDLCGPNLADAEIVADGSGGALLSWSAPGAALDVTRVEDTGAIAAGWAACGASVVSGSRTGPGAIAGDLLGGCYVAWQDVRNVDTDVFAQHLAPDGSVSPGWPDGGLAVSDAAGAQRAPLLAADGLGGAIAVWTDDRNGDSDIYAHRLVAGGVVSVRDPGIPRGPVLEGSVSNPATSRLRIGLSLGRNEDAVLALVDVTGRVCWTRSLEGLGHGRHTVDAGSVTAFRPGVYFIVLRSGNHLTSRRVSILH